ncbi:hypothetical protein ACIBAH_32460 [Streptomyces sp. NPDC051445]|uniref:hypothetical protein n=1 Tax=Streptomyces sp. NPDC051445 TaxID=3365653 RepID=UPI00378942C9
MSYEDRAVTVLEAVADRERAAEHGWALDWDLRPVKQRVFNLAERGLAEFADRDDRAALSAWEGRAVRWAVRLTARPDMTCSSTAVSVPSLPRTLTAPVFSGSS